MKKIVTSLYLLCCVCMCQLHAANNVVDSLLSQLDHVIQNRPVYIEQKEKKLNEIEPPLSSRQVKKEKLRHEGLVPVSKGSQAL